MRIPHTRKIDDKGRVTIPKAVVDRFSLKPGDRMEFDVSRDGSIRMRRADGQ